MQLSLQTFTNLVQGMAAAVQSSAAQLLDLSVGSTLRAILEASASVALWMQWLMLLVLQMTRAATSNGGDLDSWMADFSLVRLAASPASGMVAFSRYNSGAGALIPVGALVRTIDGSETFAVVANSSVTAWNSDLNGYIIGSGVSSLDVPVVAQTAGSCGNIQADWIVVLATALSGVDSVSNGAGFTNGIDAELDNAFRLRFQNFLSSRAQATLCAVRYAISSVQQGLSYIIQENQNPSGQFQLGNFVVVVDDGSGYPSNSLLSVIQQAIEAVRPVGSTFAVFPPVVSTVDVSLTITTTASADIAVVIPQIVDAIETYVNSLSVGASLPASRVVQIAYTAASSVVNVTGILLNNQPSDIVIQPCGVVKIGTVVVS